jgi:hypothetical protein
MSVKAYGSVLQYGDTADYTTATSWTTVGTTKSIKPGKVQAKDIDTTHLESADEFEESVPGLANGGDVEASLQYDKSDTGILYGVFRVVKAWRLKYPDNSGWKFNGHLNEIGDEDVVNGEIVMTSIKIKVTGKPVPSTDVTA